MGLIRGRLRLLHKRCYDALMVGNQRVTGFTDCYTTSGGGKPRGTRESRSHQ